MKAVYERPNVYLEFYGAENAFAASCDGDIEKQAFECLRGPNTDTENVISALAWISECEIKAGYASAKDYKGIINYDLDRGNSIGNNDPYFTNPVSYNGGILTQLKEGVLGFLYICSNGISLQEDTDKTNDNSWQSNWKSETVEGTYAGTYLAHSKHFEKDTHVMIAAVTSANVNNS